MKRYRLDGAIFIRSVRGCDDAVTTFKDHHPPLDIIEIKHCHMFKFQQGLEVKLNARAERKLLGITSFSVVLGLEKEPSSGINRKMCVYLGEKLRILRVAQTAN